MTHDLTRRACLGLVRSALRGLLAATLASFFLALPAQAGGADKASGTAPTYSSQDYDYFLTGNAANVVPERRPRTQMTVLMGGGLDVDQAYKDMIAKAGGDLGGPKIDVVVIRASGADGYNQYLYDMGGVDSVETLVIKTRAGANDPRVRDIIAGADMLFIAGGDQWNYVNLWNETEVENTIKTVLLAARVPIGGTSAGLMVLGAVDFSAQNGTITSDQALGNPYDRRLTLDETFLETVPSLGGTITDAHLVTRDRMGRLVTFLARMVADGRRSWSAARAIGVDEETALVIDNGIGRVLGNPGAARAVYFLRLPQDPRDTLVVKPKTPLEVRAVQVDKITADAGGDRFNLDSWLLYGGTTYQLSVQSGVLYGPGGNFY